MIVASARVARADHATLDAIAAALDGGPPLGLIAERTTDGERAALTARLAAAALPDDAALVVFTSGSTGRPKGVVFTRAAIAAAAAASAAHLGERADDGWLLAVPLGHVAGVAVVARARRLGARPRLGPAAALADPAVTHASLVPTQLAQLLADPAWRPSPRLRLVLVGGAAAAPALLSAARARGVPAVATYGMTETFGQIATGRVDEPVADDGAIGPLLPGVTVAAGTAAAPAPLRVRAPGLFTGYLDEPTPPLADGFVTRDLGYLRGDRLVVVGRVDDVIITGGENVYPAALEAALTALPGVIAAAVVGLPDPVWGERVAAAVEASPALTEAELVAALATWPAHHRPRPLVRVDALPRLPSGKLDRRAIAADLGRRLQGRDVG